VTVAVHERAASAIDTEIEAGRFDLGCGVLTYASPNLRYERLLREKLSLVVSPGHSLASQRSLSVKELKGVPLCLLQESFDMRRIVDDLFRKAHARPRVAYEISSISATLQTVSRSGMATVLTPIVLAGRRALKLRAIPLRGPSVSIDYGLVSARSGELSPSAQAFATIVMEQRR